MRARFVKRLILTLPLLTLGLVHACQSPTQVTLDISTRTECSEITGTAIAVGTDAKLTEEKLASTYVNAQTRACDPSTKKIGTLVLTPDDKGVASIMVVAGYRGQDPSQCKPPFDKCIVARRIVSFITHAALSVPVVLDPDCVGMACDALTTCFKAKCVSAKVECDGSTGTCGDPGATTANGTDGGLEATVLPDGRVLEPGDDGSTPLDGSTSPPACKAPIPDNVTCQNGSGPMLACGALNCSNSACCDVPNVGLKCVSSCGADRRYCCVDTQCGANERCLRCDGTEPKAPMMVLGGAALGEAGAIDPEDAAAASDSGQGSWAAGRCVPNGG